MKNLIPNFFRWYPVASIIIVGIFIASFSVIYKSLKVDDRTYASLIGVQHLGSDYLINTFYVDGYSGGNVGEEGGGGGAMCCIGLPKNWRPGLKAEVRWEVHHIIRANDLDVQETAEVAGVYRALAPVEAYSKPGDFYVHFFRNGRVRIVVSGTSPSGEKHPIQWGDVDAGNTATAGIQVPAMFSVEEIAASEREVARNRAKLGDWR